MQPEHQRGGVSLMLSWLRGFHGGLALLLLMVTAAQAQTQAGAPAENWVERLAGLETPVELDLPALRQEAQARVKSKADAVSLRRPPIAPQLLNLPRLIVEVKFDEDTPIVRPESYRTLGRIADTLTHPSLLSSKFLIVGHVAAVGRRDFNLALSQRRADAIRDILVTTFKIPPKRLHSIGLGEEQLLDASHPNAVANQRIQIATVGRMP
jgi:OmpA-OmpF porin, OOP family